MADSHTYSTNLQWSINRKGKLSTPGMPTIEVATPPEFPGGHPHIWSPEHLFVGAAEICLMTTFLAIAEKSKLEFADYTSNATGVLEKSDIGLVVKHITIYPKVTVFHQDDIENVIKILEKSERHCIISNSMKTEVSIKPTVEVKS